MNAVIEAADAVVIAGKAIANGNADVKALAEYLVDDLDLPQEHLAAMAAELAYVVARFILVVGAEKTS